MSAICQLLDLCGNSTEQNVPPNVASTQHQVPNLTWDAFAASVFPFDSHDCPKWWEERVAELLFRLGYSAGRTRRVLDLAGILGSVECVGEVEYMHKDAVEHLLPESVAWYSPRYNVRAELGMGAEF